MRMKCRSQHEQTRRQPSASGPEAAAEVLTEWYELLGLIHGAEMRPILHVNLSCHSMGRDIRKFARPLNPQSNRTS